MKVICYQMTFPYNVPTNVVSTLMIILVLIYIMIMLVHITASNHINEIKMLIFQNFSLFFWFIIMNIFFFKLSEKFKKSSHVCVISFKEKKLRVKFKKSSQKKNLTLFN